MVDLDQEEEMITIINWRLIVIETELFINRQKQLACRKLLVDLLLMADEEE